MGFRKGSRRFLTSVMSSVFLTSSKHSSSLAASLARPAKRAMWAMTCEGSRHVSREKYAATYSTSQEGGGRGLLGSATSLGSALCLLTLASWLLEAVREIVQMIRGGSARLDAVCSVVKDPDNVLRRVNWS